MGADKPTVSRPDTKVQTYSPLLFVALALLLVAIVLLPETGYKVEPEAPKMKPEEKIKLFKRLRELDDSEQYALIAAVDGWYPCLHSGRTTYYLKASEVWKYGVTSKGKFGRYTAAFLIQNKVSYIIQFKGNLSECLKQEQIKLYNYPYLPENLARPPDDRLPRPPYNPIMR